MNSAVEHQPYDLLVCGDVVTPEGVLHDGFVGVHGDEIAVIGSGPLPPARVVERYESSYLFPGLIDAQVHAGSFEGIDGLQDATRAAAAGGVTVIVDMPFDDPLPVNSVERLEAKIEAANRLACSDVALYATLPKQPGAAQAIADFARSGAAGIKLSTYEYDPVRFPRFTTAEMYEAFCEAAAVDLPVAFHNEDEELVRHFLALEQATGDLGPSSHAKSRPPMAELVADAQILELASHTGVRCHIVHSSLAQGCDIARHYRERSNRVSVETCVHYLIFTNDDMVRQGGFLKLNPPLRSEHDRQALWCSLERGDIDLVSTDHVPWPVERKTDPDFFKNGSGIPGLETLLAAFYTAMLRRGQEDVTLIARLLAENPARHFGLFPRRGQLRPSASADIAVFRRERRRVDSRSMTSKIAWTPYDGMEMEGFVTATYLRGKKIYDGQVLAAAGFGRFTAPLPRRGDHRGVGSVAATDLRS